MPRRRPLKNDHLIPVTTPASKAKAGVWFGDRKEFKERQAKLMAAIKDKVAWIPVEDAIIAVREEPRGIVLIAPNPTLPGMIILADGAGAKILSDFRTRTCSLCANWLPQCLYQHKY